MPARIFPGSWATDWKALAWGVNVGGFGFVLGSLANLIALRLAEGLAEGLAGGPGLWLEFHRWSIPTLFLAGVIGRLLFLWVYG